MNKAATVASPQKTRTAILFIRFPFKVDRLGRRGAGIEAGVGWLERLEAIKNSKETGSKRQLDYE
jgi:hypothetical protein